MKISKVYLYVFNTMSDWEYGYLIAELNSGRYFKNGLDPLNVITIGTNKESVKTMGGLHIKPDMTFGECKLGCNDLLILPGGTNWNDQVHQPILEMVGIALDEEVVIAAICGAADALANSGYLDTRKHTSNNLEYTKMICPNYKGEKYFEMESVVSDENLITASGIAPLEFAREVLKKVDVFEADTLEAWYKLNKTYQIEYFYKLMDSIS
ncbi:type 1 glutamine amidotransferase family protein [Staphylococcus hominis]|uniref:type 1 glutamine amidotransferase family protein n=1 Tax=Staphylococcus hominis TaxID=1290 RepID=UPI00019FCAB2|nr:type 1 glutamine amidotransferase family protein [Staphylococcus hominis]EEK11936.1 DJ-1/PfpI family protein [Staphylococcus hominis SK119]MCI2838897.1 glutamine amidotransferase [Staphylococcus hominis]QKH82527.1 glutamine amidotransferase [Staphylococcus hominis]